VNNRAARASGGVLLLGGVFLLLVTLMEVFGSGLLQRGVEPPSYSSTLVCPGCGRRSRGDAHFCSSCGAELG
jgi:hypothetical protein